MKHAIAAASAALMVGAILAPPAVAQTPATNQATAATAKSDYSKKKQNRFWRTVSAYEPAVRLAGKRDTINLGISTCDYLRAGGTLYGLAAMVYESDAGIAEDAIMAVIAAAPVILCTDQQYKFE